MKGFAGIFFAISSLLIATTGATASDMGSSSDTSEQLELHLRYSPEAWLKLSYYLWALMGIPLIAPTFWFVFRAAVAYWANLAGAWITTKRGLYFSYAANLSLTVLGEILADKWLAGEMSLEARVALIGIILVIAAAITILDHFPSLVREIHKLEEDAKFWQHLVGFYISQLFMNYGVAFLVFNDHEDLNIWVWRGLSGALIILMMGVIWCLQLYPDTSAGSLENYFALVGVFVVVLYSVPTFHWEAPGSEEGMAGILLGVLFFFYLSFCILQYIKVIEFNPPKRTRYRVLAYLLIILAIIGAIGLKIALLHHTYEVEDYTTSSSSGVGVFVSLRIRILTTVIFMVVIPYLFLISLHGFWIARKNAKGQVAKEFNSQLGFIRAEKQSCHCWCRRSYATLEEMNVSDGYQRTYGSMDVRPITPQRHVEVLRRPVEVLPADNCDGIFPMEEESGGRRSDSMPTLPVSEIRQDTVSTNHSYDGFCRESPFWDGSLS